MSPDRPLDEFWDAALDGEDIDDESIRELGDQELDSALSAHRLLQQAAKQVAESDRPAQLGRFEVLGDLGAGGLGRVYLCWDPELRRQVAVKVIARDHWAINEARSIARLDHRAVVKVFEVGHDRIVMELLDGGSLAEKIEDLVEGEESNLVDIRQKLHCLARLAEGLAYCHQRGILHRDVKPANVLFAKGDDHPRLVDFGLAHIENEESLDITQNLVGSPAYLAPEQVESGETGSDQRSDIFSFGVLAQELLTLESPFRRDTFTLTLNAIRSGDAKRATEISPDVPMVVEHIVQHCLEIDPNERYQSMEQVALDLHNALANRPISVGGRSMAHRARLLYRRNKKVSLTAIVAVLLSITIASGLWLSSLGADRSNLQEHCAAIEEEAQEARTPLQFQSLGLQLSSARTRATEFDRSFVGRVLFGAMQPIADSTTKAWSLRLGEVVNSAADFENQIMPALEWKSLLHLDHFLWPINENHELRELGSVTISEDISSHADFRSFRQVRAGKGLLSGHRKFLPIELNTHPENGSYLLMIKGLWSRELLITSPWQEAVIIDEIPRTLDTTDWFVDPAGAYVVSPLLTFEDVNAVIPFQSKIWESKDLESKDPANCNWDVAFEIAARVGGRLPLAQEVAPILRTQGRPDFYRTVGELVSDYSPDEATGVAKELNYDRWSQNEDQAPITWLVERARSELQTWYLNEEDKVGLGYSGFRVVYDLDYPLQPQTSNVDKEKR